MRRLLFICVIFLGSSALFAQRVTTPLWTETDQNSTVGVYGFGSVVSTSVQTSFIRSMMRETTLTRDSRTEQLNRLSETGNRIGGDYIIGLQGAINWGGSLQLNFNFTDEAFAEATFDKEAFDLAFFGNKAYSGDSVRFDGSFGRFARFQKLGLGLSFQPSDDATVGFMASFLNGESVASAEIDRGWFYTSSIGDTVAAGVLGSIYYSDTSNTGFMAHNGAGVMFDFFMKKDFDAFNSQWQASALLMNLGMIQWRPNTEHYRADTMVTFSGVSINDFTNIQREVNAASVEDSVLGGLRRGFYRGPVNQLTPAWVQVQVQQVKDQGFVFGIGVSARMASLAKTYGYINPAYAFGGYWRVGAELGYGGFGSFQAGVNARFQSDQFLAQLRVANLESFIAPAQFAGITISGGLQYFFEL